MTLPEIADFVGENNLEFLGFIADGGVIHRFRARFPQDEAAADLALWHAFETDNPGAFAGMYQFWIRKNGSAPNRRSRTPDCRVPANFASGTLACFQAKGDRFRRRNASNERG